MNFLNFLQGIGSFADGKPGNAVGDFMTQLRQQMGTQSETGAPVVPPMGGVPPIQEQGPLPYKRPEGLLNKLAQAMMGGM